MRESVTKKSERRAGYHHGDLRRALIEAGLAIVEEEGSAAVTLAVLARRCRVSVAAPYRHFESKEVLLEALAGAAMLVFRDALAQAARRRVPDAHAHFLAVNRAVVRFAMRRANLYQLAFGSARPRPLDDLRGPIEGTAFGVLLDLVGRWQSEGLLDPERDSVRLATSLWATSHGLASLLSTRRVETRSERAAMHLVDQVLGDALVGLAPGD